MRLKTILFDIVGVVCHQPTLALLLDAGCEHKADFLAANCW